MSSVHFCHQNHTMNFHLCHKQDAVVCETQLTMHTAHEEGLSTRSRPGDLSEWQCSGRLPFRQMFVDASLNLHANRISR